MENGKILIGEKLSWYINLVVNSKSDTGQFGLNAEMERMCISSLCVQDTEPQPAYSLQQIMDEDYI